MDATISAAAIKSFTKCLACLAKVGEHVFIEVFPDKVQFSTANSSRSAFALITLAPAFFEKFQAIQGRRTEHSYDHRRALNTPTTEARGDSVWKGKILIKALANVFRLKSNMERALEHCRLLTCDRLSASTLQVQFLCKHGISKTHKLNYEAVDEVLLAHYDKEQFPHHWRVGPRVTAQWLSHFNASLEEVSMLAGPSDEEHEHGWIKYRSYTDIFGQERLDVTQKALVTEIELDPSEFDDFGVTRDTELTFNLKEFKSVLAFAESLGSTVHAYFDRAGVPVLFEVKYGDLVHCEVVLATIQTHLTKSKTPVKQGRPDPVRSQQPMQSQGVAISQEPSQSQASVIEPTQRWEKHAAAPVSDSPTQRMEKADDMANDDDEEYGTTCSGSDGEAVDATPPMKKTRRLF